MCVRYRNVVGVLGFLAIASSGCTSNGGGGATHGDDTDGSTGGSAGLDTTSSDASDGSDSTTSGDGDGDGDTGGMDCVDSIGSPGVACPSPGPFGVQQSASVTSVSATMVDENSAPIMALPVALCGESKCVSGMSDTMGEVLLQGGGQAFDDPCLRFGDGVDWAVAAAPLVMTPTAGFGSVEAIALPPQDGAPGLVLGGSVSSGGVTLELDADAYTVFDTERYCLAEEQGFRATLTTLDPAKHPEVDPSLGLEVFVALAPVDTTVCPPATLRFANMVGWSANAEVEFFLHGTDQLEPYAPFGAWGKIAEGVVDGAGNSISTKSGVGIPVLGLLGVRLKP